MPASLGAERLRQSLGVRGAVSSPVCLLIHVSVESWTFMFHSGLQSSTIYLCIYFFISLTRIQVGYWEAFQLVSASLGHTPAIFRLSVSL